MPVVYIVVAIFVIAFLLSIPLFPFWKVWSIIKTRHPDIWASAGPFDIASLIASPGLVGIFINVLIRLENDKERHAQDPELGKWSRLAMEVARMLPRSFLGQIGWFLILLYFTHVLTALILLPFWH